VIVISHSINNKQVNKKPSHCIPLSWKDNSVAASAGLLTGFPANAHAMPKVPNVFPAAKPSFESIQFWQRNVNDMLEAFTLVPLGIGATEKFPLATGGDASSVDARRNDDSTALPFGHAASSKGPTMSSARAMPPHPPAAVKGNVIWPMKSVVGFSGRAMPNANCVLAPKKRWNWMPVTMSVKGAVVCALLRVTIWREKRRVVENRVIMLSIGLFVMREVM